LQLDLLLTRATTEGDQLVREQDKKKIQKLLDQRNEHLSRLERLKAMQEGKSEQEKKDLIIEEEMVTKRKNEVEKLIREEINNLN